MLKTTDWIVTSSDVQKNLGTVLKNAQQRPLIITEEGRPTAYVLSIEMFDQLFERVLELDRTELDSNLVEGEKQFVTGNYITLAEALKTAEARWQAAELVHE